MPMTVNPRTAQRCCTMCDKDYGHGWRRHRKGMQKARDEFRRTIKRREKQEFRREVGQIVG